MGVWDEATSEAPGYFARSEVTNIQGISGQIVWLTLSGLKGSGRREGGFVSRAGPGNFLGEFHGSVRSLIVLLPSGCGVGPHQCSI